MVDGTASDDGYRAAGALLLRLLASAAAAGGSGRVRLLAYGGEEFAAVLVAAKKQLRVEPDNYADAIDRAFPRAATKTSAAPPQLQLPTGPAASFIALMQLGGIYDGLPVKARTAALIAALSRYPAPVQKRIRELVAQKKLERVLSNPSAEAEQVAAALATLRVDVVRALAPSDIVSALVRLLDPKKKKARAK